MRLDKLFPVSVMDSVWYVALLLDYEFLSRNVNIRLNLDVKIAEWYWKVSHVTPMQVTKDLTADQLYGTFTRKI